MNPNKIIISFNGEPLTEFDPSGLTDFFGDMTVMYYDGREIAWVDGKGLVWVANDMSEEERSAVSAYLSARGVFP